MVMTVDHMRQVAHSSVPTSALMHSGPCPVHRGFIAMSGRSLRPAQISDELAVDRALNPLRGSLPAKVGQASVFWAGGPPVICRDTDAFHETYRGSARDWLRQAL